MNSIKITGRLTANPELKHTQSGISVCTVDVAVDRNYSKDKEVDFFKVTCWQQTAEFVAKYLAKGRKILVEGEMQSSKYTDKNGNKRTDWTIRADRVEFCDSRPQNADDSTSNVDINRNTEGARQVKTNEPDPVEEDENDDSLPF